MIYGLDCTAHLATEGRHDKLAAERLTVKFLLHGSETKEVLVPFPTVVRHLWGPEVH